MREIKFRGKQLGSGEWVYGHFIKTKNHKDNCYISQGDPYNDMGMMQGFVNVDPETVGQSTGLKDNNGKEIYEGDILGWMWGGVGQGDGTPAKSEVYFDRYKFAVRTGRTSFGWKLSQAAEVIGNVHENPELLEGK